MLRRACHDYNVRLPELRGDGDAESPRYARTVTARRRPREDEDDRPPICPACGVTQGMKEAGDEVEFVCLECGFSDAHQG
jgi:ribosomal protein L37AE/L43A